jgi:hypothetical protein
MWKYRSMWLNSPNIRLYKYPKGWVVEIEKTKWYGKKYWTHLISVYGIKDQPWHYKTYDIALKEATKYFRWELIRGTHQANKIK